MMDLSISRAEEVAMPTTKDQVHEFIGSHSIVIFSKTTCPYCKMAKQVLSK